MVACGVPRASLCASKQFRYLVLLLARRSIRPTPCYTTRTQRSAWRNVPMLSLCEDNIRRSVARQGSAVGIPER